MPQVHCYLPEKTVDKLEEIQSIEGHESLSKAIKEVIDLGIKVYFFNKDNEEKSNEMSKEEELEKKHTAYILRILGMTSDILRCVFDKDKVSGNTTNPEEQIASIKDKVDLYIEEYKS
jgi:DNA-directed RNA polymerase subunit F|tara:strand:- start:174 stop:527 length:354 start_codon:yes stop_codon:yes gene_type:complete